MLESKKRINAFIPLEYYSKITQSEESFSDFITKALVFYFNSQEDQKNIETIKTQLIESNFQNEKLKAELNEFNKKQSEIKNIIEEKESKIKDLQAYIEILKGELGNLKNQEPETKESLQLQFRIQDLQNQINAKDESQQARITDLKEEINLLHEQLKIKDDQIEKLNDNLKGQVANIFNLTQNAKLLPESKVKRWWEFWKN
jgi:chromosome segregation ATPase